MIIQIHNFCSMAQLQAIYFASSIQLVYSIFDPFKQKTVLFSMIFNTNILELKMRQVYKYLNSVLLYCKMYLSFHETFIMLILPQTSILASWKTQIGSENVLSFSNWKVTSISSPAQMSSQTKHLHHQLEVPKVRSTQQIKEIKSTWQCSDAIAITSFTPIWITRF